MKKEKHIKPKNVMAQALASKMFKQQVLLNKKKKEKYSEPKKEDLHEY